MEIKTNYRPGHRSLSVGIVGTSIIQTNAIMVLIHFVSSEEDVSSDGGGVMKKKRIVIFLKTIIAMKVQVRSQNHLKPYWSKPRRRMASHARVVFPIWRSLMRTAMSSGSTLEYCGPEAHGRQRLCITQLLIILNAIARPDMVHARSQHCRVNSYASFHLLCSVGHIISTNSLYSKPFTH